MQINKLAVFLIFFVFVGFQLPAQQAAYRQQDETKTEKEDSNDTTKESYKNMPEEQMLDASNDNSEDSLEFNLYLITGLEIYDYSTIKSPIEVFQTTGLKPAIETDNFEFSIDLKLHFRFVDSGHSFIEILEEEWVPEDFSLTSILDLYLPKIDVLRWGSEDEPLFFRIGKIDEASIGTGFLINSYSNNLFQINKRIVGLEFDMDGFLFDFPYFGIESMIGNLARFDVLGTRLYFRPLYAINVPVIRFLEIGATVAADRTPDIRPEYYNTNVNEGTEADMVIMYNGDLIVPVLNNENINLAVFGNFCYQNAHLGGDVGIGGRFFSIIPYYFQFRKYEENFMPYYFDRSYDIYRGVKYDIYNISDNTVAIYEGQSWTAGTGLILFDDKLSFRISADGPFALPPADDEIWNPGINYLDFFHLHAYINIAEDLIPNFATTIRFDRMYVNSISDLLNTEDSIFDLILTYKTDFADLNFEYKFNYAENGDEEITREDYDISTSIYCTVKLF